MKYLEYISYIFLIIIGVMMIIIGVFLMNYRTPPIQQPPSDVILTRI